MNIELYHPNKTIVALDIGKVCGLAVSEPHEPAAPFTVELDTPDLDSFHQTCTWIIDRFKPDLIIYPAPTRFYNVFRSHYQKVGILNHLALINNIQTIEVIDSSAKKETIGTGKAKKEDVIARYNKGGGSEHVCDACMFLEWYIKKTKD